MSENGTSGQSGRAGPDAGANRRNQGVTRLPTSQPLPQPDPPSRPTGLHGAAITSMASSAIVGIILTVALITVDWTSTVRKTMVVVLVLTCVAFLASATTAVFAAARATYPRHER